MTRRTSTALTNATFDETLPGAGNLCTYLDWDSDFFGKRIARLNISQPTHFDLSQASTWCLSNRIDCLYLLAEADDSETGGLACQNNFLEVDVRLTLARPISQEDRLSPLAADSRIRSARESDLAAVRRLARTLHRDTRFYSDPRFERFHCDLLYETWIFKKFRGSGSNCVRTRCGWTAGRLHRVQFAKSRRSDRAARSCGHSRRERSGQGPDAPVPVVVRAARRPGRRQL